MMHIVTIGTHKGEGSVCPKGRMATATWPEGLSWEVVLPRTAVQRLVDIASATRYHHSLGTDNGEFMALKYVK